MFKHPHWNQITGDSKYRQNVVDALIMLSKYHQLIKFNVINYDYTTLANRKEFQRDLIEEMIYTKFPERIVYGLLRDYRRNIDVRTHIYIEDSTEYKGFELDKLIMSQLNIQSLYRGENYVVESSELVPKGEEIGVELTDLLLGVIRTILSNKPGDTKGTRIKNEVVIKVLKNEKFYSFIREIRYFEWTNAHELTEINFNDYLQLFLATHHSAWTEK